MTSASPSHAWRALASAQSRPQFGADKAGQCGHYARPAAPDDLNIIAHMQAAMADLNAPAGHTDPAPVPRARALLLAARDTMENLAVNGPEFHAVERGLRHTYRDGRRNFARAYRNGQGEDFHDWRKSVQLHWRHMALMSRAWPEMFSARIEAARQLSQLLGDAQDLSVLIAHIEAQSQSVLPKSVIRDGVALAQRKQGDLRGLAQPRGAILFSLRPKALSTSVIEIWRAARTLDELPQIRQEPNSDAREFELHEGAGDVVLQARDTAQPSRAAGDDALPLKGSSARFKKEYLQV